MRKVIAGALLSAGGAIVGPTVVAMMWPTIDPRLGWALLIGSGAAVIGGLGLLIPDGLEWWRNRKSSATAPPDRNVWLRDAIWYAQSGKWEPQPSDPATAEQVVQQLFHICAEFRQRAFDGIIPIWGKIAEGSSDGLWHPILGTYWADFEINYLFLIEDPPESLCTQQAASSVSGNIWDHLMTDKQSRC